MPTEPTTYTSVIQDFVRHTCSLNEGMPVAIVLIGSVARSTQTSHSDLDLLVIGDQQPQVQRDADRLHVQAFTTKEFTDRLRAADDFAAWCVRYGIPLVTSQSWLDITRSADAGIWPDWHKKVLHAARRLSLASALLKTGDVEAAAEELLYATSHAARAILLRERVFPLSRPEIVRQLLEKDHKDLANVLKALSYDEPTGTALKRYLFYIKRLLVFMDRPQYRAFVQSRQQHLQTKRDKLAGPRLHHRMKVLNARSRQVLS